MFTSASNQLFINPNHFTKVINNLSTPLKVRTGKFTGTNLSKLSKMEVLRMIGEEKQLFKRFWTKNGMETSANHLPAGFGQ